MAAPRVSFTAAQVQAILEDYLFAKKPPIGAQPNELDWSKYNRNVITWTGLATVTATVSNTKRSVR